MKSKILSLILIVMLLLAGCSQDEVAESEADDTYVSLEESSVAEVSEEVSEIIDDWDDDLSTPEEVIEGNVNPLTGLYGLTDEAVGKRPVAVMVNNIRDALPQYGIEQADIIFEMPVEGYQTRLMAIYGDYTQIPKVCSVRSCRKYFAAMAKGFDAIYVNCGINDVIKPYVRSLGLTQYDGAYYYKNNLFARDPDRRAAGYAIEHTLYFDGTVFPKVLKEDNARLDILESKEMGIFSFNGVGEQVSPEGKSCSYVYVDFGANESGFRYDAASKTYLKDFAGDAQFDGKTGNQLSFTNVFILETHISKDKSAVYNSKGDMHMYFDWHGGTGSVGYYLSNGKVQEICWVKENEDASIRFYDKSGNELKVNRGKSYICFNEIGCADFTE